MKQTWLIPVVIAAVLILYAVNANASPDDGSTASISTGGLTLGGSLYNTVDSFTAAWARAIAPAENVNPAYNDPGGLNMQGDLGSTYSPGSNGKAAVIGIFSSLDAGYAALQNLLSTYVSRFPNATLLQATSRYITGNLGSGDPSTYPANVRNEAYAVGDSLGADVNETLSSLAGNS